MSKGYVRLWRKSIDGGLIKNHKTWVFWTWCLMKANSKIDYKITIGYQEIILQPGDFIFGRKMAAKETGLSEQNIRTCLVFLKKVNNLTIKPTNKFSIISIVNWATYQFIELVPNQQSNQQVTNTQPASNHKQEQLNNLTIKEEHTGEPSPVVCPQKEIRILYNSKLPQLPQCKSTNKTVEAMVRTRWREEEERQNIGWWEKYFKIVAESKFLTGKTDSGFQATFEWLVRPTNMSKVLNGNYKNRIGGLNGSSKNFASKDTRKPVIEERLPDY